MDLKLVIDSRERYITEFTETLKNINYEITQINIGDYALIINDKIHVIFERKTWADAAASFKDKRWSNREKMLDFSLKNNCKVIFIMEGTGFHPDKKIDNIPYKSIETSLMRMCVFLGFSYITTKSKKDSVDYLIRFYNSMKNYYNSGSYDLYQKYKKGGTASTSAILEGTSETSAAPESLKTPILPPLTNDEYQSLKLEIKNEDPIERLKQKQPPKDVNVILKKVWKNIIGALVDTTYRNARGARGLRSLINNLSKNLSVVEFIDLLFNKPEQFQKYLTTAERNKYYVLIISNKKNINSVKIYSEIEGIGDSTAKLINDSYSIDELVKIDPKDEAAHKLKDGRKCKKIGKIIEILSMRIKDHSPRRP